MTSHAQKLHNDYPWITPNTPLISSAPMRLISVPSLPLAVSRAGGLGFIAAGTDASSLPTELDDINTSLLHHPIPLTPPGLLPIGIGFILWGSSLPSTLSTLHSTPLKPAAIWLFAPHQTTDLALWTSSIRAASPLTKIWIQTGTVAETLQVALECAPDVLVIQGSDAGGHGLANSSSIISLLPECADALAENGFGDIPLLAAGGISDGRGVAAAWQLGAVGVSMGTRFLATPEAKISNGYRDAVVAARDGGVSTARTTVYDRVRGTAGWPERYDGRGVLNETYWDERGGMGEEENQRLYKEAMGRGDEGWGVEGKGRMTAYAGTGVGLIRKVMGAGEVVREVQRDAVRLLERGSKL
ncbi:Inosine monophosphate dehydrogenase (IMPDH) [Glarea lozoyensis ATCC 20868]|uniref:Inosine monophosphate dehydrogenase (IMPDH) n=1 Tax=Glarea lozoyensis (strain ATCC 20868 / MF5171) TaxID=1116229 RepID=S3D5F9_GLAL2|nr:Inosine monophosphate dehydrogenase (IMPDH) [Glarea lozoyensis ATCC 20868]EPE32334.1 Inosine monophosphate dehydrogenase (IMPDH) [Glarea lozoyensis ATCC 20868]